MKKFLKKLRFSLRDFLINRKNRKRLINRDVTIIANDCVGGCIYKDLKQKFNSPTINCFFSAEDYICFLSDLKGYLNGKLIEESDKQYSYPLCRIFSNNSNDTKGILVHCMHYKSTQEFIDKWNLRKKRVNFDKLFIFMNDRNSFKSEHLLKFNNLNYKNKVCFVHKPIEGEQNVFYLKGSENDDCIKPIVNYKKLFGIKRFYDQFDYVEFFNNGTIQEMN